MEKKKSKIVAQERRTNATLDRMNRLLNPGGNQKLKALEFKCSTKAPKEGGHTSKDPDVPQLQRPVGSNRSMPLRTRSFVS
jgi:hypothetical protein